MRIDWTMVGCGSYDITRVDQPSSPNSTPSIKILDLSVTMPKSGEQTQLQSESTVSNSLLQMAKGAVLSMSGSTWEDKRRSRAILHPREDELLREIAIFGVALQTTCTFWLENPAE